VTYDHESPALLGAETPSNSGDAIRILFAIYGFIKVAVAGVRGNFMPLGELAEPFPRPFVRIKENAMCLIPSFDL
jgi:hypothetical protein